MAFDGALSAVVAGALDLGPVLLDVAPPALVIAGVVWAFPRVRDFFIDLAQNG